MQPPSRRRFVVQFSMVAALLAGVREAHAQHYPAWLCGDCGFGSKKDDCAKCGKWMGSTKIPARLCSDHGFGSKGDDCVKCGKWVASQRIRAHVCNDCGFGSKKENCVICDHWAP